MRKYLIVLALSALLTGSALLSGSVPSHAAGGISPEDVAQVTLLPGWRTASGTHMTALRVQLARGWKTYWRAPGEAGIPPRFDWAESDNLSAVAFMWPVPSVFVQNGMRSLGYKHELILPMELTPADPGRDIRLRATIELGVCENICMPVTVHVAADLGRAGVPDPTIRSAIGRQPASSAQAGLRKVTCAVEPIADGLRLTARIDMPPVGDGEMAVFELPDQAIWVAEANATRQGRTLSAVTELVPPSGAPFMLDRSDVRITVIAAGKGVEIQGCTG